MCSLWERERESHFIRRDRRLYLTGCQVSRSSLNIDLQYLKVCDIIMKPDLIISSPAACGQDWAWEGWYLACNWEIGQGVICFPGFTRPEISPSLRWAPLLDQDNILFITSACRNSNTACDSWSGQTMKALYFKCFLSDHLWQCSFDNIHAQPRLFTVIKLMKIRNATLHSCLKM